MPLNHDQGEALLDVYDQCKVVSIFWWQQEAAERAAEATPEADAGQALAQEPCYKEAMEQLTSCYAIAEELGVAGGLLDRVCIENLPQHLVDRLFKTAA